MVIFLKKGQIERELERLYFHGVPLKRYIETDVFLRMFWWLGKDLSFELAALAMIVLRDNPTATFYQGVIHRVGDEEEGHAWVEFKRGMRWYVMDFSCGHQYEFLRADYFGDRGHGKDVLMRWKCNFDLFWSFDLAEMLWVALHFEENSYVMKDLMKFRPPEHGPYYAFDKSVLRTVQLIEDGRRMQPFYIGKNDYKKPISTEIIQDFLKKPTRQHPKLRTLRKTMREIKQAKKRQENQ